MAHQIQWGGTGLLSGQPMFQQRMGGGMFAGSNRMFPAAGGGGPFGGGPEFQASINDYFDRVQAQQAEQLHAALLRRQLRQDKQYSDRELTLKERLAQQQMDESRSAQALARDRLGLDWNTASADAAQRANALSLQERLGWAGENRMSAADQAQNALAMKKFESDQFNADRSFNQLSAAQQEERNLAIKRMEQESALHDRPTGGQLLANLLGEKQLKSGEEMTRYTHGTPSGGVLATERGANQRALWQAALAEKLHETASGGDILREAGAEKRATLQDNLARYLHETTSGNTAATLAQSREMYNQLSATDKKRFEMDADFRRQTQANWEEARQFPSFMEFMELGAKERAQNLAEKAQEFHQTGIPAVEAAKLADEKAYRDAHLKQQSEGTLERMLTPYIGDLINADPETRDRALQALQKMLPVPPGPQLDPGTKAAKRLFDAQVLEAQKSVVGVPKTIEDVSRQNAAVANTLFLQYFRQKRPLNEILKAAAESDRNSPPGATSTLQTLQQRLRMAEHVEKNMNSMGGSQ